MDKSETLQSRDTAPGEGSPAGRRALFSWALYDWANSAYVTVIQTFVFAAYFTRQVAASEAQGTALWGYTIGIVGLAVALTGPLAGAAVDRYGPRKPWLALSTGLCVSFTAMLWFARPSTVYALPALAVVACATFGYECAAIFYNAMLPRLASSQKVGRWSGWGWALGYAGGLVCLAVCLLVFVSPRTAWFDLDRNTAAHVRITFPFVAVWYLLFALPLFIATPDVPRTGKSLRRAFAEGAGQLWASIRGVRHYSAVVRFLITRMIYVDGLATIFAFGGVYAAGTFDMDAQGVLIFGIALNVTAGIGAALFAWVDDWIGSRATIIVSLLGLIVTGGLMLLVNRIALFWGFGLTLGLFVGPVQAASRSYLARAAPPALRNQMFGLYALSGKATAFLGPFLVGWVTALAGSQRAGMSMIIALLVAGLCLMLTVPRPENAIH